MIKWTTKAPTAPGWYWWRSGSLKGIVQVRMIANDEFNELFADQVPLRNWTSTWWSNAPITEPQ